MKRFTQSQGARVAHLATGAACVVAAMTAATNAHAVDPTCASLTNPVYVSGSSASQSALQAIAGALGAAATPVTLVYIKSESCDGVHAVVDPLKVTASAVYFPGGAAPVACTLPTVGGQTVDVGVSDVFATTCPNVTLPASQKDFQGPIQAMVFVAHPQSTENVISAEAARVVLKYANTTTYPVAPWTDAANIFIRPDGSGTKYMLGTAMGLTSGWQGVVKAGSGDVLKAVAAAQAAANASLGILSVTLADLNRPGSASATPVKTLAFQSNGQGGVKQSCGYFPDSTSTSFDKVNVRDGRYAVWGPLHFVTNVDGTGKPTSASAPGTGDASVKTLIDYVTLATTVSAADKKTVIDADAASHVVAQCAMRVRRTGEVGAEASYQPDEPCGCYWESKANGAAPASCHACPTGDGDCAGQTGSPKCRYGFCEAK
jgi:hypothetical protein